MYAMKLFAMLQISRIMGLRVNAAPFGPPDFPHSTLRTL
jgi:hypothetical protein